MADKPKDKDKKAAPPKEETHPLTPIVVPLFILLLLSAVVYRIQAFAASHGSISLFFMAIWGFLTGDSSYRDEILRNHPVLSTLLFLFKVLAYGATAAFIYGTFYAVNKLTEINKKIFGALHPAKSSGISEFGTGSVVEEKYVNKKWEKVLDHINSKNPSDWKLAILEADIMLDEMLDKMSYHGESIGEKLKGVEVSDFNTIDYAWEAHKIRNSIAHEGSDFLINEREARRVVTLYQAVFEEFKYI